MNPGVAWSHRPLRPQPQETLRRILNEMVISDAMSPIIQVVKENWKDGMDLMNFLLLPSVQEVLVTSSDINLIKEADVVLSGTSSSSGFLTLDLFKKNSVIVDIAVPATIKKELLEEITTTRPDVTYHLGGIAEFPQEQSLCFPLFPLGKKESFACMAETFSIGFSGKSNFLNIGDLNKAIVQQVEGLAAEAGFKLGNTKTSSSL